MLVLSRKPGEALVFKVGTLTIVIRALKSSDNRIRLGIEAPQDVTVHREELLGKKANKEKGE
jgi:carbon storage regulator CsrA